VISLHFRRFVVGGIGQDWGYQVDLAFGSMGMGILGNILHCSLVCVLFHVQVYLC
jgi:hypothetical protein